MKDFEPKFDCVQRIFGLTKFKWVRSIENHYSLSNQFFWFLYKKDEREGAHMKDFDQKLIVPKGFWD